MENSESTDITRGLIIAQPWIGKILRGEKSWEMRSAHTSIRGGIALIEKGTGSIVGVASIEESVGPLSFDEIFDNEVKHCVGPELYTRDDYKWDHAWVMADIKKLNEPVRYQHKNGAVIWVELDENSIENLATQLDRMPSSEGPILVEKKLKQSSLVGDAPAASKGAIPSAKDGTSFCKRQCTRNGVYTVGEKGDEHRFKDYNAALDYLRKMPTAKWRRPNAKGNWGIVSATRWQ